MNTAFIDAQNLAWKLHHVEAGFANRSILRTYETERKQIAENLLDFDAKYAKLFSERLPPEDVVETAINHAEDDEPDNPFIKAFKESCEFTSGYGVAYPPNIYNWISKHHHAISQHFLKYSEQTTLRTGRVLHPANVTRVSDCNVVHLEQQIPINGSFRIYIFCGNMRITTQARNDFGNYTYKQHSYFSSYLRPDIDTVDHHERHNPHSLFYTFCTIFNAPHADINIKEACPNLLARYNDHVYADDVGSPEESGAAHIKMGLSPVRGGVVVVRPDGYVGCVVDLVEGRGTVDALNEYFGAFVTKKLGTNEEQARL